jgi:RimJ/RimL family protein N-acetyltransferase
MLVIRNDQIETLHRATAERLAREAASELDATSPHAILGLTAAETEARLQTALAKARVYSLVAVRDLRAFVQLCFRVGPNFDEYPRFQGILNSETPPVMADLFDLATDEDWMEAAIFDIVSRSQGTNEAAAQACASLGDGDAGSPQVSLVELSLDHAASYHQQALHPDVWRLADIEPLLSQEAVEQHVRAIEADPGRDGFAIMHPGAGFVGAMILYRNGAEAQLLYWVGRRFWNRGVATAAVKNLLAMVQERLRLPEVRARAFATNAPSLRVLEKCGFVPIPEEPEQVTRYFRYNGQAVPGIGRESSTGPAAEQT